MSPSILITGAAGYIGGSLVADFLASNNPLIKKQRIIAAVRSEEQATALSKLGISVLQLDLTNEDAVIESLVRHEVHIVIHTASSLDAKLALPMIKALSKQREISGEQTYYIHTSGLSAFYEKTGWPSDVNKDTGPVFETEKQLADSFPIRKTDVTVIEYAKEQGVKSFIVVPCDVYGKGSGTWNQLSVVLPVYIRASISRGQVNKFAEDTKVSGVHISDLTALYGQLVEKALTKENIPCDQEGYYFALAHDLHMWEVLDHLAAALKARGIVQDSRTDIWPSDQVAAEALGVPEQFVQVLWNSGENITAERPYQIGWKPTWDRTRFLQNIDEEVQSVLDIGQAKSSLIDSLFQNAKG